MGEKPTRFEAIIKKIQNHPIAAVLLVLAVGIIAISEFMGAFDSLWNRVSPEPEEWQAPPLRVRYLTLEGHALSLFVMGELEQRLEDNLGSKPSVAQNEVYRKLKEIHDRFAYARQDASYFTDLEGDSLDIPLERFQSLRLCPGTVYGNDYIRIYQDVTPAGLIDAGWALRLTTSPYVEDSEIHLRSLLDKKQIDVQQVRFEKFLSREEALRLLEGTYGDRERDYFEWLTQQEMPSDLFLASVDYDLCGESFDTMLDPLRLRMRVLILENLLEQPVELTNLAISSDDRDGLRSEFVSRKEHTIPHLVADDILDKGEIAIVPLRLYLSELYSDEDRVESDFHAPVYLDAAEILRTAGAGGELRFIGSNREEFRPVSVNRVIGALERSLASRREYLIGPALSANTILVNEKPFDIRSEDVSSIHVSHGYEFGSCPHIYVMTGQDDQKYRGKLLTGRDTPDKRGWYYKTLPAGTRSLLIMERESEVTYLDALQITATVGERELLVTPRDEALRKVDGKVRMMEKGDTLEVDFPDLTGLEPASLRLDAFGHYEPLLPKD